MASRVLTVMFTDIKGFTERTSKSSRDELEVILKEHEDLLLPFIPEFGGRLIKTVGDALMIVFDSPTNAVLCGIMMQERLRERNKDMPEGEHLEVRIAINSGEILERDGDVFGEAVNIAARIEGITEASEIYFTESVYLAMNKAEVPSSELGMRRLKGIPEPIKIYRVIQDRLKDEYQQLLERLRTTRFGDIPVPSAGTPVLPVRRLSSSGSRTVIAAVAAVCAVGAAVLALFLGGVIPTGKGDGKKTEETPPPVETPKPPDPVLEAAKGVDDAISAGDFALALARAEKLLKEHADRKEAHEALKRTVAAEVRALTAKNSFDDALKLLEERRKTQNYLKFEDLEREVLLGQGAYYTDKGDLGRATEAYGKLYRSLPDDLEVNRTIAKALGRSGSSGIRGLAEAAAKRVAKLTEGPLDDDVAAGLLGGLGSHDPYREDAAELRKILAERYPPTVDAVRPLLADDHRYKRINAMLLLREAGKLTPEEELGVNFKNLTLLRSTGGSEMKDLQSSLDYLEQESAKPDWKARKSALPLDSIAKVEALRARNETSERVFNLIAKAFYPEIEPSLKRWLKDKDLVLRDAAFLIVKMTPLMSDFDVWSYHAGNLMLDDYQFRYRIFADAAEYFGGMAKTNRAEDAKAVLEAAKARMQDLLEKDRTYQMRNWRVNFDFNFELLEKALKALE